MERDSKEAEEREGGEIAAADRLELAPRQDQPAQNQHPHREADPNERDGGKLPQRHLGRDE